MGIGTAIAAVATVGGALIGNKGAKDAAKSQTQAAKTAADAQVQATQMQIDALKQGADKGEAELRPVVDQGDVPINLLRGAQGIDPSQRGAYDASFNSSVYAQNRDDALAAAQRAALGTNAAAGKGGAFNSGKAIRSLRDNLYTINSDATDRHTTALGSWVDRADAARSGIANLRIGQGTQAANAFGQQGANLANIAMQNGQNQAAIQQANAANMSGYFGAGMGQLSNVNWGNVFGGGSVKTPPYAGGNAFSSPIKGSTSYGRKI